MISQQDTVVSSVDEVAEGVFLLKVRSSQLAESSAPGQFVNVLVGDGRNGPLLRRPFSVCRVDGDLIELLFNIVGEGTRRLALKRAGELLDVIGPLGRPFGYRGVFDTAIIVAGGLGVAPFPFLTDSLQREEKQIMTFLGARTKNQIATMNLKNVKLATDDGSSGHHGTVVSLLEQYFATNVPQDAKIFGCGPTRMMKALAEVSFRVGIECELSLEGDMGCGIGICQGCPVELVTGETKYALVCTQGPTFLADQIMML